MKGMQRYFFTSILIFNIQFSESDLLSSKSFVTKNLVSSSGKHACDHLYGDHTSFPTDKKVIADSHSHYFRHQHRR